MSFAQAPAPALRLPVGAAEGRDSSPCGERTDRAGHGAAGRAANSALAAAGPVADPGLVMTWAAGVCRPSACSGYGPSGRRTVSSARSVLSLKALRRAQRRTRVDAQGRPVTRPLPARRGAALREGMRSWPPWRVGAGRLARDHRAEPAPVRAEAIEGLPGRSTR